MTLHPFSQASVDRLVNEEFAVAEGKTRVIGFAVDDAGAKVVVGLKSVDGVWQVQAAARREWTTGEVEVGGKVLVSW